MEAAAAFERLEMMGSGCDREIRYGEGSPWFDIVLPCGGGITLTSYKLRSAQPLLVVLNRLEQRKPAGCATIRSYQSLVCLLSRKPERLESLASGGGVQAMRQADDLRMFS